MKNRSFSIQIVIVTILISISFFVIISVSAFFFVANKRVLREQNDQYYHSTITYLQNEIIHLLMIVDSRVKDIGQNPLLLNGLVDELGREQYLPHLLSGFRFSEIQGGSYLALYDFQGELIESNERALNQLFDPLLPKADLINRTIQFQETVRGFYRLSGEKYYYLEAIPVKYENHPEGFLVLIVDWSAVWEALLSPIESLELTLFYKGVEVSTSSRSGRKGMKKESRFGEELGIDLTLITLIPDELVQKSLYWVAVRIAIFSVFLLLSIPIIGIYFTSGWVSKPVVALKNAAAKLASGNWQKVNLERGTLELVQLAETFNQMAEKLEKTQNDLINSYQELDKERGKQLQQAYKSGMAENAIAVLHNIGNAITPVAVNLRYLSKREEISAINQYLEKFLQLLKTHLQNNNLDAFFRDDEKGKQMIPFLEQMVEQLYKQIEEEKRSIAKMDTQIKHVGEIISIQQKYADFKGEDEVFQIESILLDVIQMVQPAMEKRGITLDLDLDSELPSIKSDKNKLVQVFLNLLKNAIESIDLEMKENPNKSPTIGLSAITHEDQIQLVIKDNGIGIDKADVNELFKFGYTTKEKGSGFGLHDCANFIRAKQGSLSISSSGRSRGAEITITLPAADHDETLQ